MTVSATETRPELKQANELQSMRLLGGSAVYFTMPDPSPEAAAMTVALEALAWAELSYSTD